MSQHTHCLSFMGGPLDGLLLPAAFQFEDRAVELDRSIVLVPGCHRLEDEVFTRPLEYVIKAITPPLYGGIDLILVRCEYVGHPSPEDVAEIEKLFTDSRSG